MLLTFAVSGFVSFGARDHLVPDARRPVPADDVCLHGDAGDGAGRDRDRQLAVDAGHEPAAIEPVGVLAVLELLLALAAVTSMGLIGRAGTMSTLGRARSLPARRSPIRADGGHERRRHLSARRC